MGLVARILTIGRDGGLIGYTPRLFGPSYRNICITEIPGDEGQAAGCPAFYFSKDSWHTGSHERVVLVPDCAHGGEDDDWHVFRWGLGGRFAHSPDPRFRETITRLLGTPWPESAAARLCDTVEKVI